MAFLPGWHSIESAAWVHDLFEKSSLLLVAMLAISIGVAYLYGQRRDYLSDETRHAMQAAPVEGRIEVVPKPAPPPEIHSTPAANQPVIEGKNPPDAPRQSPGVEPQASIVEKQASGPEESHRAPDDHELHSVPPSALRKPQSIAAGSPAGIEIQKSGELGGPQGPRRLNADQRARLHSALKGQARGRLVVRINPSVPDAANYGVEIARFFKHEAGWTVRIDNSPFTSADPGGMWLALRSADAVPPATGVLHAALAHAHVPVRPQPVWDKGGPAPNEIWLVIGRRA